MKYLYFKIWQCFKRIPTNDTPATNAMILVSIMHFANLATVQVLINHFFQTKIELDSKNEMILFSALVGVIIYLINYFLLYKKREKIFEKYKNENKTRSRRGYIILILYILTSFALVFYFGSKWPLV